MIAMHHCGAMNHSNVNTGGTEIKCRNIFMPNNTWDAIILLTSFENYDRIRSKANSIAVSDFKHMGAFSRLPRSTLLKS